MDDRDQRLTAKGVVAALLLGVALFGICAEVVLSFFFPPGLDFKHPQELLEPNPRRIYGYRPNQNTFTIDQPFATNSLGFREREIPPKLQGELRVLSLGDSLGVGLGVSAEDTYAHLLEDELQRRGRRAFVINASVASYSYWQEIDLLQEKGLELAPDVVVLAFFWNDLYLKPRPVTPLPPDQSGEERDRVLRFTRLLKRSRTLLLLRERWNVIQNRIWPGFDWRHQEAIHEGRTNPYLEQAFEELRESLVSLRLLATERHFAPLLMVIPTPTQVLRPEMEPHLQDRLRAIASETGIPMLDLLSVLRAAQTRGVDLYIPWDYVHLSHDGHATVAAALADVVAAEVSGARLRRPEATRSMN